MSCDWKTKDLDSFIDAEHKVFLMVNDVAPVRRIHGRSKDGIQCRCWCTADNFAVKTLQHALG